MSRESTARGACIVVLIMLIALPLSFHGGMVSPADAVPSIIDHGNGNKTVVWDFSDPSDYSMTNITLTGGAELDQIAESLTHDTDQDFSMNGTWDTTNLTISGGAIGTKQERANLVANGDFTSSPPWNYMDSSDGNTTAFWDSSNMTANIFHNRPTSYILHFDEMDIGAGTIWNASSGGSPPQHGVNVAQDTTNYVEPTASTMLNVNFKNFQTNWAGLYRNIGSNWINYDTLSVWFNTSHSGPQQLIAYINLVASTNQWKSQNVTVTPGWKQFFFDISGFGANLSAITQIIFCFTNVSNTNPVFIWIDDIWLFRDQWVNQTAGITQDFRKNNFTNSSPGNVFLNFSYRVVSAMNVTGANLTVAINTTLWSSPPLSVSAPTPWTPMSYDISSALAGKGLFNISFIMRLSIYTASMTRLLIQLDNISLTIPYNMGGTFESFVLDLGHCVFFDQISWQASSPPETNVTIEVRGGYSNNTSDGSWTSWELHNTTPGVLLSASTGRYLQYRMILFTNNTSVPVSLSRIDFTFHRYSDDGRIDSLDYLPAETLIGWRRFGALSATQPETLISFYVSDDSGGSWTSVTPGSSLDTLSGATVRVRADLFTSNTTMTPRTTELNVTYEYLGILSSLTVMPAIWNGTADEQVQFTAIGRDAFGHAMPIIPIWTTLDPWGSVNSTGMYQPGMVGNWTVCADDTGGSGLSDCSDVNVSPGALASIVVTPSTTSVMVGSLQRFTATGFDSDGNSIQLTSTQWLTDVGWFEQVGINSATFRARSSPGLGSVSASQVGMSGSASVTIIASTSVYIQGRVPNQIFPEDSPPWYLDLTNFLPVGQNSDNLMWYFTGKNDSLYSVFGERTFGQHTIVFSTKPDAYGSNRVTIWLENKTGAKASQNLWVNITPVNDAPVFYNLPPLFLRFGVQYGFDYSPYIIDVDTPKSMLILSTSHPDQATVTGLRVSYTFDYSYNGQTILVHLTVSDDGGLYSETIHLITIGDNTPPNIIKALPNVVMNEDEIQNDAFPEVLSQYFTDPGGDQLYYSYISSHLTIEFWLSGPGQVHVRMIPESNWFGSELIVIRATDSRGALAEQSTVVTVQPVNDAPILGWYDDVYVKYDVLYALNLNDFISDIDNSSTELRLQTNRTDVATVEGFVVHIMLPKYLFGSITSVPLSLSITDGLATEISNITVFVGDNQPPMPVPGTYLPDVVFNEDEQAVGVFRLNEYFMDIDVGPQPLSYTFTSLNVIPSIDARNNSVNFSAPQDWFGQEVVHVRAFDGLAFTIARVNVRVVPMNDAPVINQIPDQNMNSGITIAIDLRQYVHDVDNNITQLIFSTDRPRATVKGYILLLDYTGATESELVTLIVSDTQLQVSRSFNVFISYTPPPTDDSLLSKIIWPWSLLVLLIIPLIGAFAYTRSLDRKYSVEDAFMVSKEGKLMMHNTRHAKADRDEESLMETLSAVMRFIKEEFVEEEGEVTRKFMFNNRHVLVQSGVYIYVATVYSKEPPEFATESLLNFTKDVETEYGDVILRWSGEADEIGGLKIFMDALVAHRKYNKGDWKKFLKERSET